MGSDEIEPEIKFDFNSLKEKNSNSFSYTFGYYKSFLNSEPSSRDKS